jgi:hypothetical protein
MRNEACVEPQHETVENIGARIVQLKRCSRVLVRRALLLQTAVKVR